MDINIQKKKEFSWINFYMEFADKLLHFKSNRSQLLMMINDIYKKLDMRNPFTESDGTPFEDICPFTVFGCFNKGIKHENRIAIAREIRDKFKINASVPIDFDGIPILNNINAWFFHGKNQRNPNDIPNLWNIFEAAINYADDQSDTNKEAFITFYDKVRKQAGIKWNLTMGLYWIRPYAYINLDERNRYYLTHKDFPYHLSVSKVTDLKQLPSATVYLELISAIRTILAKDGNMEQSFPELSYEAWKVSSSKEQAETTNHSNEDTLSKTDKNAENNNRKNIDKKYWIYAPGSNSSMWEEFYTKGIMGIEWDEMGNLQQYSSKEAMKIKMKVLYGSEYSYVHSVLATWQFANDIHVGDIVYAKKGMYKIIGRGIVESDYIYDEEREHYKHIRKVRWTHKGEWDHPGQAIVKTLTDITPYIDDINKLEALFIDDNGSDIINENLEINEPYDKDDFLNEVFMDSERYDTLVKLLKAKKNIILQGAPGVGKTFLAKRLAYSIMGQKDNSRIMMVQFHQSYSYEDFIMGYRPSKDGFELKRGPFYDFCKNAQDDDERDYFFIIDEINRGNVSKIFGELMMLIEKEKRGEQMRLLYSNELFSVPKNVYIIGMMNTADRSLAIIDYALRRRFAFFEIEPAFDSKGFRMNMEKANNLKLNALVDQIKALNEFISMDESLGSGFRIGHSYLCTDDEVSDEWLRAVVEYELLPLLNEYWFDEPAKIEQWQKRLRDAIND